MTEPSTPIQDVQVVPLTCIGDERGAVLHMLRCDFPGFDRFGEIYFSEVNPGTVKAWKRHQRMTQRFAVPCGHIKLVIFDDRPRSPTRGRIAEIQLGRPDHYHLVILPPMLWYGFQALGPQPALLANCSNLPHDPSESESRGLDEVGFHYEW
ncbi:MAG: dTDP-4-dehydrorhamnose 3,5-epimerase family protein [Holophaga sp.]|jgi:dTDP-4-dehydrorhamnose 3,5-epimerase